MIFEKIKNSYSFKLIIIFMALNLICISLPSTMFYFMLRGVLIGNYGVVVSDTATQVEKEIDRKLSEIRRVADTFIFDQNFHNTLRKQYDGFERQRIFNEYFIPKGKMALILSELDTSIKLYVNNGSIPEHYNLRSESEETPLRRNFEILHSKRITDTSYYKELYTISDFVVWRQVENDKEDNTISLIAKLTSFSALPDSGILRIVVSLDDLFGNSLPTDFLQEVNYKVFSGEEALYTKNSEYIDKDNDFNISKTLKTSKFSLTLSMPQSNISDGVSGLYNRINLVAVLCFILTFIIAFLFKKSLYRNITKIVNGVKEFKKGNYDYTIETAGSDEFQLIGSALNNFAQSTGHLINDIYEVMIQKQDIELQMLQAKINPHFMYNIFSIISQLSAAKKNDDIIKIVEKTAKFYRSALSKKTALNNLSNELEILDDYFSIIDVQRPNSISVKYEIDEKTLDCLVPNFILQPIAENSVKHAMVDGKVNITVGSKLSDGIVTITLKDDGIGMETKKKEDLFKYKKNSGYGLYNINERIRLRYEDPKFNIQCESERLKGTKIILTLPFKTEFDEDVENYV